MNRIPVEMFWIPIDFALPLPDETVLAWREKGVCAPMQLSVRGTEELYVDWWNVEYRFYADDVTHWMPLPQGPDEKR